MTKKATGRGKAADDKLELELGEAAGLSLGMSFENLVDAIRAGVLEVRSIERDQAGVVDIEWLWSLPPPGPGEIDSAFDPWSASMQEAFSRGTSSREFGAWATAQVVGANRLTLESDGVALLEAVGKLMDYGLSAPHWMAEAFRARLSTFQAHQAASLDEAFGHDAPNKRALEAMRRHRELRLPVHGALLAKLSANPDRAIDGELYEEVAAEFGISRKLVEDLCKEAVAEDDARPLVEFKRLIRPVADKS